MDKRWILIVDIENTIEKEKVCYLLQEIKYEHPQMFYAVDREGAIDYCVEILKIPDSIILWRRENIETE